MIAIKIHFRGSDRVLAACDFELLGQSFKEGNLRLNVTEGFYNGEVIEEDVFIERMKSFASMNLVGEKTIGIAIREGYIDEDCVVSIDGVKHAQYLRC